MGLRWPCTKALNPYVCDLQFKCEMFDPCELASQWKERPPGEAEVAMRNSLEPICLRF